MLKLKEKLLDKNHEGWYDVKVADGERSEHYRKIYQKSSWQDEEQMIWYKSCYRTKEFKATK